MAISNGAFKVSPQLKEWMKSKRCDQRRLAEALKLDETLICQWFTQKPCKHPSWQTLKKLCLMTGFEVGDLLIFDPHGKQYKKWVRSRKSTVLALSAAIFCGSAGFVFAADIQAVLDDLSLIHI